MPSLNTKLASAPNTQTNYVLKATSSTTIGNSIISDDGTTASILGKLSITNTYANDPLVSLATTTSGNVEVQMRTATTTYNAGIGVVTSGYDFGLFTNNTTRMTITSAGNVGIGTSSPTVISGFTSVCVNNATTGGFFEAQQGGTVLTRFGGQSDIAFIDTVANIPFIIKTNSTERMRITSGGNVLIGSSNESTYGKLQVTGVIWINFGNYLYTNSRYNGAAAGQLLINNGTGENLSLNETASNRYAFGAGSNGVAITRNVFEMDMSTGACFMKQYGNGTMSISGGQIATSSDKNLKIDDGGIDNALNKVLQLNPRYFYWKEESGIETTERQLGFYAQDVNQALGVEVANDNGNGKWGIYDRALIAMVVKSVQELSQKVTAQQEQINQLINK